MAKKDKGPKIPKKVLGFKLSKGTRKDLRLLLQKLEHPDAKALAITAATALVGFLSERMIEGKTPLGRVSKKAAKLMAGTPASAEAN